MFHIWTKGAMEISSGQFQNKLRRISLKIRPLADLRLAPKPVTDEPSLFLVYGFTVYLPLQEGRGSPFPASPCSHPQHPAAIYREITLTIS
jgi:hypothetical protein